MPALHELVTGEAQRGITAVLGPTNTGKTHLALERMLRHRTGMIGLPLRLLAREVFDKLVDRVGEAHVALITGEEKIVPNRARYFVCTVEAMPDRAVHFLAVDEVQLAAHRTRGHVFTDRLMRARGLSETLFLGSSTARGIVQRLVPTAEILGQPRLSKLRHAGHHTLKRLPERSAVVAFSTERVYEIAERVRQKHGGAAIVLGALSPRTRNAQVDLYQNGDVPVLVATDAIGMGLNLDVNHVAFAATRKFDGRSHRSLYDDELAQIAGRAGRFLRDGTFGTTGDADPLDPEVVDAIEQHQFTPIKRVWWRNPDLEFSSVQDLLQSLERPPRNGVLKRMTDAEDHRTLTALTRIDNVAKRATTEDKVRLLWEVAAIPDYRNSVTSHYTEMLGEVYGQLEQHGELNTHWIEERLARLDRTHGDIDALMARIAHVRTWTYISHKRGWNADPIALQERARQVEDRLSDALHASLTARFVDHRVILLPAGMVPTEIQADALGRLCVDGTEVGRVVGLALETELGPGPLRDRVREAAARRGQHNALDLVASPDDAFSVDEQAQVLWKGHRVARWER
ncbi:MAG: helicase-related protein, partial [Myxococcota bacterium]